MYNDVSTAQTPTPRETSYYSIVALRREGKALHTASAEQKAKTEEAWTVDDIIVV
jgi:hypothetical protein